MKNINYSYKPFFLKLERGVTFKIYQCEIRNIYKMKSYILRNLVIWEGGSPK